MNRERVDFDVVVVGAGPAGLSAAIKLKQLARADGVDRSVCLLEKGSAIGAHILSGAVMEPTALAGLWPNGQAMGGPLATPVTEDHRLFLTPNRAFALPVPPRMGNRGNVIVSLGALCRWLGEEAEKLGVELFPGFAAAEILYDPEGAVCGVVTGKRGLNKKGEASPSFQEGVELHARQTIFAEGCRGSLTRMLFERFALRQRCHPQSYALGIKELWAVDPQRHVVGKVVHTVGWPLPEAVYGGGFLYHCRDNRLAIGLIVGLDYQNPWFSPFEAMQRFKSHPAIRPLLATGRRVAYGARTLSEGGYQAIPELAFPGGLLVGDAAGFLNVEKMKGIHGAIQSGVMAAEAIHALWLPSRAQRGGEVAHYLSRLQASGVWQALYAARNIRPGFEWGLWPGLAHAALESGLLRGRAPWTLQTKRGCPALEEKDRQDPIHHPQPDGVVTFDRTTSIALSHLSHREDQPVHLHLRDGTLPGAIHPVCYGSPETRYCPAGVFEIRADAHGLPRLQINGSNCLHCKTCDIMAPTRNLTWMVPEGGSGPRYDMM